MQIPGLIVFCFAFCHSHKVFAEGENEVKRGGFPYMAFIYYPDPTVVDETGARFVRGAVLIQPDWLLTSALSASNINASGFPRKTLLARLGAVTIDANFTLNEDEDEQEREVIQIVRPYSYSVTQWWRTDITLMKTLLPFNMTPTVAVTTLKLKQDYTDKTCSILVYAQKYSNWSQEKNLMQYSVVPLSPSIENCGSHFANQTMICAADIDENTVSDPNFCHGNSGGPLVCDGEVKGLQTYVENNCKQPHLYQRLSAWNNFIDCGINDKCQEEQCKNVCDIINKDTPVIEVVLNTTANIDFISFGSTGVTDNTTTSVSTLPNTNTDEIDIRTTPTDPTYTAATTEVAIITDTANTTVAKSVSTSVEEVTKIKAWPNEKFKSQLKQLEEDERDLKNERKPKVEARRHNVNKEVIVYNAVPRNMCTFQTIFSGFFFLAYFV